MTPKVPVIPPRTPVTHTPRRLPESEQDWGHVERAALKRNRKLAVSRGRMQSGVRQTATQRVRSVEPAV